MRDRELFGRIRADPEVHTRLLPNGADFDPATLHEWPGRLPATKAHVRRWRALSKREATGPKATSCKLYGEIIGVDEALHLRGEARRRRRPYPPFRCRECDELVRPHKKGTTDQAAHFEHRESSPGCPLGA